MKTVALAFDEAMSREAMTREAMSRAGPDAGDHRAAAAAAANRARSNTWSVGCTQPMTLATEVPEDERVVLTALQCSSAEADSSGTPPSASSGNKDQTTSFRKNWTRRNAWGNLSYAELITKAIESSAEKRLTLSQIYDWIVHNVQYFANKGDNSSSAGWKNSIRHNLSLHSRFVRLVNDGAGKSSWWSINPDAQPLKPSRRRAATLDSKTTRKRSSETGGAGSHGRLDFAGRSLEEVDSTTSGCPRLLSSSILSPGNSSQSEVTAMDVEVNGSPVRYPGEHGFARAGSLSSLAPGDAVCRSGSGSPPYRVRDGFRMDVFGGKGPGREPELCFSSPKRFGVHGKGQLSSGAKEVQFKHRRYAPSALEDRSISLGFCAGNGIYYDEVFDPHPVHHGSDGYYSKRYLDDTDCYATGQGYGNCHSNSYYPNDPYAGGFYGNGGCFDNRTLGRYSRENDSVSVPGTVIGRRDVGGGGNPNVQGHCAGGFPEVRGDAEQNAERPREGITGDENQKLNAFPIAGYCSPYVDSEGGKGTGRYDADQGTFRRDNDCFQADGLQSNPSVSSRFQNEEPKADSNLTDASFFRALITTSGYGAEDDFSSNLDALRPISSSDLSSHEPCYRPSVDNKYPFPLPDPTTKPFSQLLANRASYPTCRNANSIDGFYIPTTF